MHSVNAIDTRAVPIILQHDRFANLDKGMIPNTFEFNGQVISTYEVDAPEVGAGGRFYFMPLGPLQPYVLSWITLANPEFRVVNPLGDALGPQLSLRTGLGLEIPVDRLGEWRGLRLAPFIELHHVAPLFASQDVQGQVEIDLEGTIVLAGLRFGF